MDSAWPDEWPFSRIKPFLDYLCIECGLADNTVKAYRQDLVCFAEYCLSHKQVAPESITPVFIQSYARHLSELQLATSSIARRLVGAKMFLRFHVLVGLLKKDVCSALETPKTWQRLPGVLSQRKTLDLIEAVDAQDPLFLRDRAILELLYATGIRASEAADLHVQDINFQVGYLRCLGKGNKERIVPVHDRALEAVDAYLNELRGRLVSPRPNDAGWLFLSRTGRRVNRTEIWRIVQRAVRRLGVAGTVSPHTLRHCFGSHMLQGGAGLRTVQEMLGHADVTTTQIYTHVDSQHLRAVHKKYHPRP